MSNFSIESISWGEYDRCCSIIVSQIIEKGCKIDYICGVPRGGLMLAVVLSNRLGIPMVYRDTVALARQGKTVLLTEDVVKSGTTLKFFFNHYCSKGVINNIKFASLFCFCDSEIVPDFFAHLQPSDISTSWFVFPWDNDKEYLLKIPNAQKYYYELLNIIQNQNLIECPKCSDTISQIKKGKTNSGSQRFHCKFCNIRYTPIKKGYDEDTKRAAVLAYVSGYSASKVSSMLGLDKDTVLSWVETIAGKENIRTNRVCIN
ncbi:MAG: hypothetical protein FWF56_00930 [Firmicutes bacterium]|nr:hypothetical protein [Bacillota bacterium]MCL1953934.1 hypothetical protein [Bacillota bacterium]